MSKLSRPSPRSQPRSRLRSIAPLLAALALLATASPAGADPTFLDLGPVSQSFAHGNGNKIVVGHGNTLHAVFAANDTPDQSSSGVYYSTSLDGQAWTVPKLVSPVGAVATQPSIAVDGAGQVGIAWIASPGTNGVGGVYYSHRVSGTWVSNWLNAYGAEPAIAALGTRVYLTWTELTKVRAADMPTHGFPSTLRTVTQLPTTCPGSSFRLPAIALVKEPCMPAIVRIGYLFASDQQGTGGGCTLPHTSIGPRVSQLDNVTGVWSVVYEDIRTSSVNPGTVKPISLSMAASKALGNTVLAWSDVQDGQARTKLATRQPAGWVTAPFDNQQHHVHVRATTGMTAAPTEFRLAWTGTLADPYTAAQSFWRTGTWTGATPAWSATTVIDNNTSPTGRPQSFMWRRCHLGALAKTDVGFEARFLNIAILAATDYSSTPSCPPPGLLPPATPCPLQFAQLSTFALGTGVNGPKGTIVDLTEFGILSEIGAGWAIARAPNGKSARVTWSSGEVLASSESTLTLSAPRAAVTVAGEGFQLTVQDLGHLAEYDELAR